MTHSSETTLAPVDVLIVGGGPIGCLLGLQLAKFGCQPLVIEKDDKASAPIYGRATTLWPRSLEMYDQLGVLDPLLEVGVISRTGYNFRDGVAAPGGLVFGYGMNKHGDTACNFALHLRQRLTERAFEKVLENHKYPVLHQHELISFSDDGTEEYPMICRVKNVVDGRVYTVRCKYLVGADGGKSLVRKTAGIVFKGERSSSKWIRMDALVKTNMPSPRTLNSVQSDTHGLVLFCPIDDGKTRIGYVFNDDLKKKYGEENITAEVAMQEAQKALAPFSLDFVSLDWFTIYGIGQCFAEKFVQDRVILVGDACHTHSSGSAQGLNTGTHDAVNLAWKLALVLKNLGKAEVLLDSYNEERRSSVQQVIDNDSVIATLISGHLPPRFQGRTENPRDLLTEWFDNAQVQAFTLGLGVAYDTVKTPISRLTDGPPLATVRAGQRGPDATITRMGTYESTRLHRVLHNQGKFHIVVFAGQPSLTQRGLTNFHTETASLDKAFKHSGSELFTYTTISAASGIGAAESLGQQPWGMTWFDSTGAAHNAYGIDTATGAAVILRPDGYIGTVIGLQERGSLVEYFRGFTMC
ncbi:uncharacterized protein IL334_007058 [Kwoniella shivajii]|uniref:FAD-binding domain-containing protein n=1 Tax=Kwoniella shivajii TaxID=564305 RepID=A0ABZ1D9G2_9TREE|nr:hypothetical protein IL334_007058 [Kwoniella shivajii]